MPEQKQNDRLQINEDIEFQKKEWNWARLGWVLMLIIALAGLLGLFGQGPLSKSTARAGGIEVEYERCAQFLRDSTETGYRALTSAFPLE